MAAYEVVGGFPPERVFIIVWREKSDEKFAGFFPFPRPPRVDSDLRIELKFVTVYQYGNYNKIDSRYPGG